MWPLWCHLTQDYLHHPDRPDKDNAQSCPGSPCWSTLCERKCQKCIETGFKTWNICLYQRYSSKLLKVMQYLTESDFWVWFRNVPLLQLTCGVSQGFILGPVLFSLDGQSLRSIFSNIPFYCFCQWYLGQALSQTAETHCNLHWTKWL